MNKDYIREDDYTDADQYIRDANDLLDSSERNQRIARRLFWGVMAVLFVAWLASWGRS